MSETFNFKRFLTYFKYDLRQMWRNHSKVALFLGLMPLFLYLIWVFLSLCITREWNAPGLVARSTTGLLAVLVLILYQARLYGHVTDRSRGSAFLMIPASGLEKFVSMILIALVIVPLLFGGVYLLLDGFLCWVDSGCGHTLSRSIGELISRFWHADIWQGAFNDHFPRSLWVTACVISALQSMVWFLLSGLIFKKWKILGGLLVSYGISLVLTAGLGFFLTGEKVKLWIENHFVEMSGEELASWFSNIIMGWGIALSAVILILLMCGVYYRIKTIKH